MRLHLANLGPPSLGSIYFARDEFPGCKPAEVVGEVPTEIRDEVKTRFVIGPTAQREFWEKERSHMLIDRGPCKLVRKK